VVRWARACQRDCSVTAACAWTLARSAARQSGRVVLRVMAEAGVRLSSPLYVCCWVLPLALSSTRGIQAAAQA